jgi:hypothetical protein
VHPANLPQTNQHHIIRPTNLNPTAIITLILDWYGCRNLPWLTVLHQQRKIANPNPASAAYNHANLIPLKSFPKKRAPLCAGLPGTQKLLRRPPAQWDIEPAATIIRLHDRRYAASGHPSRDRDGVGASPSQLFLRAARDVDAAVDPPHSSG